MKRLLTTLLLTLLWAAPLQAGQPDAAQLRAQGLAAARQFFTALKAELKAGMQKGGPATAIEVCRTQAPAIARRVGEESGWRVGRTSSRLRNPANVPDPWEAKVLAEFAAQAQAGNPPDKLIYGQVVTDRRGRRIYRLMKGIPMEGMCLVCHGPSPAPAVRAKLKALYPQDQAIGYRPGQLRGAFTLSKPLD